MLSLPLYVTKKPKLQPRNPVATKKISNLDKTLSFPQKKCP